MYFDFIDFRFLEILKFLFCFNILLLEFDGKVFEILVR